MLAVKPSTDGDYYYVDGREYHVSHVSYHPSSIWGWYEYRGEKQKRMSRLAFETERADYFRIALYWYREQRKLYNMRVLDGFSYRKRGPHYWFRGKQNFLVCGQAWLVPSSPYAPHDSSFQYNLAWHTMLGEEYFNAQVAKYPWA